MAYDAARDGWLRSQGYRCFAFPMKNFLKHRDVIIEAIGRSIDGSGVFLPEPPSAVRPSPQGEGGLSSIVIAVDGTAASGKGTLAKLLARHFAFAHLDSGSLYRLVALAVLEAKGDPGKESEAVAAAHALDLSRAGDPAIRSDIVGKTASLVSAHPGVRAALFQFQRDFAAHPPGESRGAVIDGRDIGTVICPDATAKLFVDARPETRAHRRWKELQVLGIARAERNILEELIARDHADRNRPISPMKPAPDAALLDTSDLDIDAAFAAALALVNPKIEAVLRALPRG